MIGEKATICLCPKCNCKHKYKIYWVGNGIPRVYCKICRAIISRRIFMESYKVSNGSNSSQRLVDT